MQKDTLTRSEKKLQDIVNAAETIFIEYGFQQSSMDQIAQAAQVTKRTIYKKFENKEQLFCHVFDILIDDLFNQSSIAFEPGVSFEAQLDSMIRQLWDVVSGDRHVKLKRVLIAEHVRTPEFGKSMFGKIGQRDDGIKPWIQGAIDEGYFAADDRRMVFEFVVGLVEHFAQAPLLFDKPIPTGAAKDKVIDEIADMVLKKFVR